MRGTLIYDNSLYGDFSRMKLEIKTLEIVEIVPLQNNSRRKLGIHLGWICFKKIAFEGDQKSPKINNKYYAQNNRIQNWLRFFWPTWFAIAKQLRFLGA